MESYAATNKSQYGFGGIALALMVRKLDAVVMFFMIVVHNKFAPNTLARDIAGVYQNKHTFNFGTLMDHIYSWERGRAYDGVEMLQSFRNAPEKLFQRVEKIMSFILFFIIGDDGKVNLGAPQIMPSELQPFPAKEPVLKRSTLEREVELLKGRSLVNAMPEVFEKKFVGIDSGS